MSDEVDQNVVDKQCAEIVKKNLLIKNENLIANYLSNQLLFDVEKSRCLDLEVEMSKVHNESKHISKLEREYLNLQLKYQHLQESFDNKKSQASQEAPDFNSFFKIKNLEHQIQEKDNVIRDLKVLVSNVNDRSCEPYNANDVTDLLEQNERLRAEIEKVKQHYKEMFESIKITRTSTNEQTSSLLTQIEDLKAQLEGNLKVATRSSVKTKVLAPGMYAIDVEPIPPRLKNNRNAHLTYINHLKESVETVREIVEEARVVKPLDNALNYACQYTKLSQELLEYVIGTCPKSFNERDNKAPSTPVTRKKQVTFNDKPGTSSSNTQKHEVHQKVQQTNVPVIHSTGVNTSTEASGSKPRSNTKKNRILPAKTENKKKVEDHPRTNKSVWTKVNRVDSSISSKRVVINSNSESVCKTQNCKQMFRITAENAMGIMFAVNNWRLCEDATGEATLTNRTPTQIGDPKFQTLQIRLFSNAGGTDHPLVSGLRLFKTQFRGMNGSYTHQLGPEPIMMTLDTQFRASAPSHVPCNQATYHRTINESGELFQPMFNEYFDQSTDGEPVPTATVVNAPIVSTNTSVSTTIAQDAPSISHSLSSSQVHPLVFPQGVAAGPTIEDTSITQADLHPSVNPMQET
ncbi:hypothetical protein Tco_0692252 [Tanacetum coccineum]